MSTHTINLPDHLIQELQLVAAAEGISIPDLVADLIAEPLNERVREVLNRLELYPPREDGASGTP